MDEKSGGPARLENQMRSCRKCLDFLCFEGLGLFEAALYME